VLAPRPLDLDASVIEYLRVESLLLDVAAGDVDLASTCRPPTARIALASSRRVPPPSQRA
jgi:hypothetical protein